MSHLAEDLVFSHVSGIHGLEVLAESLGVDGAVGAVDVVDVVQSRGFEQAQTEGPRVVLGLVVLNVRPLLDDLVDRWRAVDWLLSHDVVPVYGNTITWVTKSVQKFVLGALLVPRDELWSKITKSDAS